MKTVNDLLRYMWEIDACQPATAWVKTFERAASVEVVYDALRMIDFGWLDYLTLGYVDAQIMSLEEFETLRQPMRDYYTSDFMLQRKADLNEKLQNTRERWNCREISDEEYDRLADAAIDEMEEKYREEWKAWKASVKPVIFDFLERVL